MSKRFEEIIVEYRHRVAQGESIENVIENLHLDGITITESMKVLRELYGFTLKDAKSAVVKHPVWLDVVNSADALHQELEQFKEL